MSRISLRPTSDFKNIFLSIYLILDFSILSPIYISGSDSPNEVSLIALSVLSHIVVLLNIFPLRYLTCFRATLSDNLPIYFPIIFPQFLYQYILSPLNRKSNII